MDSDRPIFEVLAHPLDNGDRWDLEVINLAPLHVEVSDLSSGATSVRTVIAAVTGRDHDHISVAISLK